MKNCLLTLVFFFFSITIIRAQSSFSLDVGEDYISIREDYVVLEFEGKTSAELYELTRNAVQEIFIKPKNVNIGSIEDQFIRINFNGGYANYSRFACNPYCSWEEVFDSYFEFRFKEGKVRVDLLIKGVYYPFKAKRDNGKSNVRYYGGRYMNNKTDEEGIQFLENSFLSPYNLLLLQLSNYINMGSRVEGDW